MPDLHYVPFAEFQRVRALPADAHQRVQLFASLARLEVLYMIARAGSGHIGTCFSSLEIVSHLFLGRLRLPRDGESSNAPEDVYFSSKGHDVPALYAVLLGLGLLDFELVHKLRRYGGLPGHPDVGIPYMQTNTGSLGMGISKAKGMILANRLQGRTGNVYVLTGDGELQEGQFWESLQPAANLALGELTVIVDHNKMQSDTFVERVSSLGGLERKLAAFGWAVARADGHDVPQFTQALDTLIAENPSRPKVLVADTVKGKGVSFMEHHNQQPPDDRLYPYHNINFDPATYQRAHHELLTTANALLAAVGAEPLRLEVVPFPDRHPATGTQKLIPAYEQALVEQARQNPKIVALDGDLAKDTGLISFEETFPERFVECGIAEQDMVSAAGAMALKGLLPVVHSFACFLTPRPNEQIYNNTTERTKVVYVGSLAGLIPAGPGHSHQSVRDIALMASNPGLVAIEPCTEEEVRQALDYCLNQATGPAYLRLVTVPIPVPFALPADYRLQEGRGVTVRDGRDAVLIGYGPLLLAEAYTAADLLAERGISLKVVDLPWLNRVDPRWLAETVVGADLLVTLDNHYVYGGQGQFVTSQLARLGLPRLPRVENVGVDAIPACGTPDEALRAHRLDAASLADRIQQALRVPAAV